MSATLEKEARFFVPKPDLFFKKISLALALAATPENEARSLLFKKISFSFSDTGKGSHISTFESDKQGEPARHQKRKPDSLH